MELKDSLDANGELKELREQYQELEKLAADYENTGSYWWAKAQGLKESYVEQSARTFRQIK